MNKIIKTLIAILGGVNVVYNMFIPISISLILVKMLALTDVNNSMVIILGALSSIYRAIEVGFLRNGGR